MATLYGYPKQMFNFIMHFKFDLFVKACSFCIDHNTFLPVKLIKPFRKVDMKVLLNLTLSGPGYVLLLCCWGDPNRMFNFLLQDSVASFFGSPPWAFLCGRLRESLIEKE